MTGSQELAVVVLAAGEGTRMKSRRPKVLHELAGVPLIEHVLRCAAGVAPQHTVVVLRHEAERIAEAVHGVLADARIARQDGVPGTGRALEAGLGVLPEGFHGDVAVLSGDVPLLDSVTVARLIDTHRAEHNDLTLLSANFADPTGAGRIVRTPRGDFERIVEEVDATAAQRRITEVNGGVYVFRADAARDALARVGRENNKGEKYLTDAAEVIRRDGGSIAAVSVTDPWLVAGVNDRIQLSTAAREYNRRTLERWMRDGVTVHDPDTTIVETNVSLGRDVELLPGTQLRGATTIAEGAVIGPDTTLVDCEVGEDAVVKRADATLAVIGRRANIGPWSYLRPNTVVADDAKVGAFVETKNATIGRGSKVPHLSYVGDTEIGEGSNLGAGTITANYDGIHKHRTRIGNRVRAGSDTVFVAPVEVGDDAYTGAGTVVRRNIPSGALAISYAPQQNTEGWTAEHRPTAPNHEAPHPDGDAHSAAGA